MWDKIYADIIIDISHSSLDKVFQYLIPKDLQNQLKIGMVVNVPFGNGNKTIKGYIIDFSLAPRIDKSKIKSIIEIVDTNMTIESHLINLAVWMKERYACTIQSALRTLIPINNKVNDKVIKHISLNISIDELTQNIKNWEEKNYNALSRAAEYLRKHPKCKQSEIMKKANITNSVLVNLSNKGIITIKEDQEFRNPYSCNNIKSTTKMIPNREQQNAIEVINNSRNDIFLLHGVTGSGKTEVYLQTIEEVLKVEQQAIVLIPEISLTPQTVSRFLARFGNRVGVIHSKLSKGERYDQWRRAKNGDISIMIGARSAIFTPFSNLGIIIIDEEHELTYKSETSPKYHAKEVAIKRGKLANAKVVLGSATPSIDSYYSAQRGKYKLLELNRKAVETADLDVDIIDMREELTNGNKSIFSNRLYNEINKRLENKEQIILFLNRRGYSRFVSCRMCGYVVKCEKCDIPYTYHASNNRLICHYCGDAMKMVNKCPACESKYIKQFGIGTQKVEEFVNQAFPTARVLRMDFDTTTKKNSYDRIIGKFNKHEADILIGTQMIAKGHDFPKVTLVGVLAADLSLFNSDFRASERTFQLLTQVTGRAGRSTLKGTALIQTYTPEHFSIIRAKEQDYISFYNEEIMFREMMNYPPFSNLAVILMQSENEKELIKKSYNISHLINKLINHDEVEVMGPAPANISKINNNYRQRIILKAKEYKSLLQLVKKFYNELNNYSYSEISIQVDINPLISY